MTDYSDIPPSAATRVNALWVRRFFMHNSKPDYYESDNGTIYLEWADGDGDVTLEIGNTRVGILVRPTNGRSWYVNGAQADHDRT